MSREKAYNLLGTWFLLVILVLILGVLSPEYFGWFSDILTKNLASLTLVVLMAVIIYILAGREN